MDVIVVFALISAAVYFGARVYRSADGPPPSASRARVPVPRAEPPVATRGSRVDEDGDDGWGEDGVWESRDEWEGSFYETSRRFALSASLSLRYQDGIGTATTREVTIRNAGRLGHHWLLIGHCHLRDATRSFRVDRILEAVDLATGEVLDDPAAWVEARYRASPEALRDRLIDEDGDLLRVLFFIGKADGQLRAPEKVVIADCLSDLVDDTRLTPELAHDAMAEVGLVSLVGFKQAVGRLASRLASRPATWRQRVLEAAEAIVATQKTVHPAEADALSYIRTRFTGASAT